MLYLFEKRKKNIEEEIVRMRQIGPGPYVEGNKMPVRPSKQLVDQPRASELGQNPGPRLRAPTHRAGPAEWFGHRQDDGIEYGEAQLAQ